MSSLVEVLTAIAVAIAALAAAYFRGKSEARKHGQAETEKQDRARADRVRDDVRRARTDGVQPDDIRYRD